MPTYDHDSRIRDDACPGAVRLHPAEDGGLARIRVPGGRLTADQMRSVASAAHELGHQHIELTSRGNMQVRGLREDAGEELARRLSASGLLPSVPHERVRNILGSPLSGCDRIGLVDVQPLVTDLDERLCGDPELTALSGRFLFAFDDGRGDVAGLGADVSVLAVGPHEVALLLAGSDTGLRTPPGSAAAVMHVAARAFLAEREAQGSGAWRLAELDRGSPRVTARVRAVLDGTEHPLRQGAALPDLPTPEATVPAGAIEGRDGQVTLATVVPLGRLSGEQAAALADVASAGAGEIRLTPWRGALIPFMLDPARKHMSTVERAGLVTDPMSPWIGVTACTGRPGCGKALADVQTDAARALPLLPTGKAVHWAGCARRCGVPRGDVVDVVATEGGYQVSHGDQVRTHNGNIDDAATAVAASRRE